MHPNQSQSRRVSGYRLGQILRAPSKWMTLMAMVLAMAFAPDTHALSPLANYGFAPNETAAGSAFRMTLSPFAFDCNTEFKVIEAATTDSSVTLSFVHSQRKAPVDCRLVDMVLPTLVFKVPALKVGKYQVYAMAYPECAYNTDPNGPVCKIAVIPELIGSLAAKDTVVKPDEAWHVQPTRTPSGKAFDLSVVNSRYGNCQTSFYGQSVHVDADKRIIHLSFGIRQNLDIVCIQDIRPHGPTFSAPALKAGAYQVMVSELPACAIPLEPNGPICLIAIQPVAAAESLVVYEANDPLRQGWFVQPVSVKPNVDFRLSVLNYAYHPCAYNFTYPSLVIEGRKIYARFAVERSGADVCTADLRAGGPTFAMSGLAPGEYQVHVSTPAPCLFAAQPCEIAEPMPLLSDTLRVLTASSLAPREAGSAKAYRAAGGREASLFILPGRMGTEPGKAAKGRNLLGRSLR